MSKHRSNHLNRAPRQDRVNPHGRTIGVNAPNARIARAEIAARPYPPSTLSGYCACGNRLSVADESGVCLECQESWA